MNYICEYVFRFLIKCKKLKCLHIADTKLSSQDVLAFLAELPLLGNLAFLFFSNQIKPRDLDIYDNKAYIFILSWLWYITTHWLLIFSFFCSPRLYIFEIRRARFFKTSNCQNSEIYLCAFTFYLTVLPNQL